MFALLWVFFFDVYIHAFLGLQWNLLQIEKKVLKKKYILCGVESESPTQNGGSHLKLKNGPPSNFEGGDRILHHSVSPYIITRSFLIWCSFLKIFRCFKIKDSLNIYVLVVYYKRYPTGIIIIILY